MELLLSEEQRLLQDSAAKALERHGGVKRARGLRGKGIDRALHRELANEGWLGILAPGEAGGLDLGLTELALVLEQVGRTLAPEPVAVSAVVAAALARSGRPWASALAEKVIAGERIVGLAPGDPATSMTARIDGDVAVLDGTVDGVGPASDCEGYLVAAQCGTGVVLCHVSPTVAGVTLAARPTVDGRPLGTLRLAGVRTSEILAGPDNGDRAVRGLLDTALVAASAELLGVMGAALDMTVEYLKTRKQFGKPIGSFQALQHRAVNDYTRIASTRSLLFQICAQDGLPSSAMASALKAHASGEALTLTKSAIQMHGAIGFTDEYDVGLYLKRAMWLSMWLGNEAAHRKRYADLMD